MAAFVDYLRMVLGWKGSPSGEITEYHTVVGTENSYLRVVGVNDNPLEVVGAEDGNLKVTGA